MIESAIPPVVCSTSNLGCLRGEATCTLCKTKLSTHLMTAERQWPARAWQLLMNRIQRCTHTLSIYASLLFCMFGCTVDCYIRVLSWFIKYSSLFESQHLQFIDRWHKAKTDGKSWKHFIKFVMLGDNGIDATDCVWTS